MSSYFAAVRSRRQKSGFLSKRTPQMRCVVGCELSCTTHEIDLRPGGTWRFDMRAPNGTVYPNRIDFLEIRKPELLVFDHGTDKEDDPNRFRVTITFDTQSDGKTVLTLRQLHPSKVRRNAAIGFGAVEYGYQTLDKLTAHVRDM
jgi:uncharacterized protein YndB with AHSA1/START domain